VARRPADAATAHRKDGSGLRTALLREGLDVTLDDSARPAPSR